MLIREVLRAIGNLIDPKIQSVKQEIERVGDRLDGVEQGLSIT